MFDFFKKSKARDNTNKTAALIVAAGNSSRMNNENKQFVEIFGKPVVAYALEAFENSPSIDEIYVVARENDILLVSDIISNYGISKAVSIVPGGDSRQQSVKNGLDAVGECGYIAIHDGARPCILPEHIELAVSAASVCGAAALGIPVSDTLKFVGDDSVISGTLDRKGVWQIQTPQVFKSEIIKRAHENALENNLNATDDCALVECLGIKVCVVEGASSNIKITKHEDVYIARGIIELREEELV